ncbi:unnamed protein product [Parascedosporium putredinis]|uniref:N2227-like protein n=1 Tax=Parascedosporium putredinis TaxID=1442378 RepID=A0A9P1M7H6_9PEZI|nr:unnamed protein product [Parascedosporium putredinis]CAI7991693.1 unnamed protein product [Parascedosporium putredinis]
MFVLRLISAALMLSAAAGSNLAGAPDGQIQPDDQKVLVGSERDGPLGESAIDSPSEIHQVYVTVQDLAKQKESARHIAEKEKLLQRLSRDQGKWDSGHPRWRLLDTLYGFRKYFDRNAEEVRRWKKLYKHVSPAQKKLLETTIQYSQKFVKTEHFLAENQHLCDRVVRAALDFYGVDPSELDEHIKQAEKDNKLADRVSVSQSLKHIVRDWSEEGLSERGDAFPCLLETMSGLFPERGSAGEEVKVLLPGAGLGRLGHEVASLGGFEVTSNEWSMYMNVMSRFLDTITSTSLDTVYPFVDYWSHHVSNVDMMRPISFPDKPINSSSVLLVEGDFTTAFAENTAHFDSVVTHFFIDTARNLISYFDTIHRVLRPGGYWVNFGPLLYGTGPFVQLSLEEIIKSPRPWVSSFWKQGRTVEKPRPESEAKLKG